MALPSTPLNWLRRIRFERLMNAVVDTGNVTKQRQPIVYELTERPRQVSFSTIWESPGAYTVYFVVEDACGSWQTFVGVSAAAF